MAVRPILSIASRCQWHSHIADPFHGMISPRPERWPRVRKPGGENVRGSRDGVEAGTGHRSQAPLSLCRVDASVRRQPDLEVVISVGGML